MIVGRSGAGMSRSYRHPACQRGVSISRVLTGGDMLVWPSEVGRALISMDTWRPISSQHPWQLVDVALGRRVAL